MFSPGIQMYRCHCTIRWHLWMSWWSRLCRRVLCGSNNSYTYYNSYNYYNTNNNNHYNPNNHNYNPYNYEYHSVSINIEYFQLLATKVEPLKEVILLRTDQNFAKPHCWYRSESSWCKIQQLTAISHSVLFLGPWLMFYHELIYNNIQAHRLRSPCAMPNLLIKSHNNHQSIEPKKQGLCHESAVHVKFGTPSDVLEIPDDAFATLS